MFFKKKIKTTGPFGRALSSLIFNGRIVNAEVRTNKRNIRGHARLQEHFDQSRLEKAIIDTLANVAVTILIIIQFHLLKSVCTNAGANARVSTALIYV